MTTNDPIRALDLAMLTLAVEDLRWKSRPLPPASGTTSRERDNARHRQQRILQHDEDQQNARDWIESATNHLFSFACVCDRLGYDNSRMAAALFKLLDSTTQRRPNDQAKAVRANAEKSPI